jgi:hypothetical protein
MHNPTPELPLAVDGSAPIWQLFMCLPSDSTTVHARPTLLPCASQGQGCCVRVSTPHSMPCLLACLCLIPLPMSHAATCKTVLCTAATASLALRLLWTLRCNPQPSTRPTPNTQQQPTTRARSHEYTGVSSVCTACGTVAMHNPGISFNGSLLPHPQIGGLATTATKGL